MLRSEAQKTLSESVRFLFNYFDLTLILKELHDFAEDAEEQRIAHDEENCAGRHYYLGCKEALKRAAEETAQVYRDEFRTEPPTIETYD